MNRLLPMLLALPYLFFAGRFWFVCDDAYISFRFARNLARGQGLRYNLGPHAPVEGYSNFLWVLVAAAVERCGGDPGVVMLYLSAGCGLVLLAGVYLVLRHHLQVDALAAGLATLALACTPSMGVWASGGLATMPFALLVFATFERVVLARDPRWGAALAVLLALLRVEGIYWDGVILLLALGVRRDRLLGQVAAVLGLAYALYFGWRFHTYGTLAANTASAKLSGGLDYLARGAAYVIGYALATVVPPLWLFGAVPTLSRYGRRGLALALMALAFPAYAVVVGGDYMTFGRLLLPSLPFGAVLLGVGLEAAMARLPRRVVSALALLAVAVGVLPSFDLHPVPARLRSVFRVRVAPVARDEYDQWRFQKTNLLSRLRTGAAVAEVAPPGLSIVLGGIGGIGYASDVFIYDTAGLVSREVALLPPVSAWRHSPGHDRVTSRSHFYQRSPGWIRLKLLHGRRWRARASDDFQSWHLRAKVREAYVPDLYKTQQGWLLVARRRAPDEDAKALWDGFEARLKRPSGRGVGRPQAR